MLAQRQRDEPGRFGIGHAGMDRCGDGRIERPVGKVGKLSDHAGKRVGAGQVAHRQRHRQSQLLAPQRRAGIGGALPGGARPGQRCFTLPGGEQFLQRGQPIEPGRQERGMGPGAGQGICPVAIHRPSRCRFAARQSSCSSQRPLRRSGRFARQPASPTCADMVPRCRFPVSGLFR